MAYGPGGDGSGTALLVPPILCYHKIERRRELGVTRISPRRFARQVERLAAAGWRTLGLTELGACLRGERPIGERELAITFDDAYRGLRDHAFPVLAEHGMTATCFVITEYAGRLNYWDVAYGGRRFAHLSWRDMRRWQEAGIAFASHTATHPRLTWLSDREVRLELARSREALMRALDREPEAIAFPFGAVGERERTMALAEGYTAGFGLAGRVGADPRCVPRLPVYMWSPRLPGVGRLRSLERAVAWATNRMAIGTTLWKSLTASTSAPAAEEGALAASPAAAD